jgi:carboxylesterase type B
MVATSTSQGAIVIAKRRRKRSSCGTIARRGNARGMGFAATGHCVWPKYDIARRKTMRFDATSQVVDNPLAAELALYRTGSGNQLPGRSAAKI